MEESEVLKRGEEIYAKLLPSLKAYYINQYIAIDVQTGEYWVEDTLVKALKTASDKYPDRQFYTVRIGFETFAEFKGK